MFQSGFRPLLGLFFGYPRLWEMKKEREKVEKERERERQRDRETERQREEEGEERESVVNGEQRVVSEYVLGACFSGPLHVFPGRNVYN